MTIYEEVFDQIFSHKGGLLNYKTENLHLTEYLSSFIGYFDNLIKGHQHNNNNLPSVYIDIINSTSINAVASKHSSGYYIGINLGSILMLHEIFGRMLSSPDILKKIGDVSQEFRIDKVYNAQIIDFIQLQNITGQTSLTMPRSKSRNDIRRYLTQAALGFLINHEYAHIINGHIDHLSSLIGFNEIEELNAFNDNPKCDSLLSQTLEMDADSYVINTAMAYMESFNKGQYGSFEDIKQYLNFKDNLLLNAFAVYTFFRLFGMYKVDLKDVNNYAHPPANVRIFMILSNIAEVTINRRYSIDSKIAVDMCGEAMIEVEKAFNIISEQELDFNGILSVASPDWKVYIDKILKNWNNIRPSLEIHAFDELVALRKD